jgi:hypothetical protein
VSFNATSVMAGVVALAIILVAQRRGGAAVGGFAAGLPLVTLPCVVAVGMRDGVDDALRVLDGSLIASSISASVLAMFARWHLLAPLLIGLPLSWLVCVALGSVTSAFTASVPFAAIAVISVLIILVALAITAPSGRGVAPQTVGYQPPLRVTLGVALCAYGGALLVAEWATPALAGAISAAPTLGCVAIGLAARAHGATGVSAGCLGYVRGTGVKSAMCFAAIAVVGVVRG